MNPIFGEKNWKVCLSATAEQKGQAAWGVHRSAGTGWNYMQAILLLYPPFVTKEVDNATGIEIISISTGYVCHTRATRVQCHNGATGVEYQGGAARATSGRFRSAGTDCNSM